MNRKLWENLGSLYSVHVFNYVLPLFVLPYLARTLGPTQWGALAFSEAYAGYVSLVVEYGFGLSATREISVNRDNISSCASQVAGVLGAQILLALFCLLGTGVFFLFGPSMAIYKHLLPFALCLAVARSLCPLWYFQGLERMRLISIVNLIAAALAAAGVFTFVHGPSDTYLSLLIRVITSLGATVVGFVVLYRQTPFLVPNHSLCRRALSQGGSLFLFKSAVSFYTTANVLLLGFIAPISVVAWFSGAEKITKAVIAGISPINQAFYPRVSRLLTTDSDEVRRTAQFSVFLTVGFGLVSGLVLFLGAPLWVRLLLGPGFSPCVPVLRILAVLPPVISVSLVLGVQWMLPLRLDWLYSRIIIAAGALNVLLAFLLVPRYAQFGMAVSVVMAEILVTVGIVWVLRKRRLDPWSIKISSQLAA